MKLVYRTIQMQKSVVNPTEKFYSKLEQIGHKFNAHLFNSELPESMFSLRRGVGPLGHFVANRWKSGGEKSLGEITLNPSLFAECSWLTLFRTIAHQQCHLWQHEYGQASRAGYHNKEWSTQMERIGLMPSSTGKIGGVKTGQTIGDYVLPNGPFIRACVDILSNESGFQIQGIFADSNQIASSNENFGSCVTKTILKKLLSPVGSLDSGLNIEHKRKTKYSCACNNSVWGRSSLQLMCRTCNTLFSEINHDN